MAQLVNILLQRCDSSIPWGFRAKVENGYDYTLVVQRVTPGTISSNYLKAGDVILRLNKNHAQELANRDIDEVIKEAGNSLELIINKRPHSNSIPVPYPGPTTPVTPVTPPFANSSNYPVQPPARNVGHMSPKPSSPTALYPGSPKNASPTPFAPSPPAPSSPVTCPPPPPMPSSGSLGSQPAPPPPPPMPSGQTTVPWRTKQHQSQQRDNNPHYYDGGDGNKPHQQHRLSAGPVNQYDNLPAALQNTLSKDKKPFTYTPGGIDLSELKSPRMQRRIHLNQMDPPRNLAKVPPPTQSETDKISSPPPPETYPQPRVQLLPTVHVHNRMSNAPQSAMNRPFQNRNQQKNQVQKQEQQNLPQRTQAYVHNPYNSPVNLYSTENVAEAFNSQTGETLPGFENLQVNKPQPVPNSYANDDDFTPYYKEQHPQSRSFRLLQVMTDTTNPREQEGEEKMVRNREEDEMKFTGIKRNPIPSKAFQTLQKITGDDTDQSSSPPLVEYQPASQVNSSAPEDLELRYRGAYIPSRSFKILQSMTGGSDEEVMATKTRVPKKTSSMNIQVGNGPATYARDDSQDSYQGQWVPPSEQRAEAEPKKYMGGNIPSRSFRMLQAMTGGDDAGDSYDSIEIPVQHETTQQRDSEPRMYMGGHIPSRSFRMLQAMTDPNKE